MFVLLLMAKLMLCKAKKIILRIGDDFFSPVIQKSYKTHAICGVLYILML